MEERYQYERAYFLDLAERYAIEGRLLGKRLCIRYSGILLSIQFPTVIVREGYPVLGIPGLFDKYGIDEFHWGKINGYETLQKPDSIDAWVSSVFIVCKTNNQILLFDPLIIQNMAQRVVHVLQIINPDAIRLPSDDVTNVLCQVKHSVSFKSDGSPRIDVRIASVIDDTVGVLTLGDIKSGLKNAGKTVTASYEMLDNVRVNLLRKDTRAAVLNCATAIEIVLKKKVSDYCVSNQTRKELQDYLLKQADGYSKLAGLCKALGISLEGLPNIEQSVMKLRNKVIHVGYSPSILEANTAYRDTRDSLAALGVSMFE